MRRLARGFLRDLPQRANNNLVSHLSFRGFMEAQGGRWPIHIVIKGSNYDICTQDIQLEENL